MTAGVLNLAWTFPEPGTAVVATAGDLDHRTADRLRDEVAIQLAAGRTRIVVDCADLEFCDSSGLAVLLLIRRVLDAAGADLALERRPPRLERLLRLTGTAALLVGPESSARSQS